MKVIIYILTILFTMASAKALPLANEIVTYKDIEYIHPDDFCSNSQKLDIYTTSAFVNKPVVIYVHGGGWKYGDKRFVGQKPATFIKEGFLFVSVNYRLTPEAMFPDHAFDVAKSISWVKRNINNYGGDPGKIFLMGHSAGAHLVSYISINHKIIEQNSLTIDDIKGVCAIDSRAYDLRYLAQLRYNSKLIPPYNDTFGDDPVFQKYSSPYHHVSYSNKIPPFLLPYSKNGRGSFNKEITSHFAQKLRKSGISADTVNGSYTDHGGIDENIGEPGDYVTTRILRFFISLTDNTIPYVYRNIALYVPPIPAIRPNNLNFLISGIMQEEDNESAQVKEVIIDEDYAEIARAADDKESDSDKNPDLILEESSLFYIIPERDMIKPEPRLRLPLI